MEDNQTKGLRDNLKKSYMLIDNKSDEFPLETDLDNQKNEYESERLRVLNKEKSSLLRARKLSAKEEFALLQIYKDLTHQLSQNKNDTRLKGDVRLLEKYIAL